ncbi:MAG: DUF4064 domain-containing protein [Clostridia bacterium]|nr:DUF4064 domain-containing protein [Clostridia bacterium]
MAKVRGTSSVPMVLGIIGGVLSFPAAVCSGACAAGIMGAAQEAQDVVNTAGNTYMAFGLIAGLLAIIFGCLSKKKPTLSGVMLLVSTLLNGFTLITFNILSLICVILTLIAAIFSFVQKKEIVE